MKNLRRHIALCVLPLFLFVFLSGCESGQQDSGWDKEAYDKNSEISTQLLITYLDNHNREYPEGVASIDFDWQGNLVFFIEPDYDGLEEAIREEMGDAVFSIEYYKFTPRYLYTAKAKVEQYLASFPEGENPLKAGEPRVEALRLAFGQSRRRPVTDKRTSVQPVSYTHLDVYKRQRRSRRARRGCPGAA